MNINLIENIQLLADKIEDQLQQLKQIGGKFKRFKKMAFPLQDCAMLNFKELEKFNVVYLLQVTDFGSAKDGDQLCKTISLLKNKSSVKFKLPKVNQVEGKGNILYIGKSSGSFRNRMEQHILGKSPQTFALHLNKWNDFPKYFQGMKFNLHYTSIDFAQLEIEDHTVKKDLLELAETSLHTKYKPLLGRTGH